MNKYVSPIIEIETVEVEDIMDTSINPGENEGPGMDLGGGGNGSGAEIPLPFQAYFNV